MVKSWSESADVVADRLVLRSLSVSGGDQTTGRQHGRVSVTCSGFDRQAG